VSDTKEATSPKLVEVTLAKPHTHAGTPYVAGAKIKVTETERDWLAKAGVIEVEAKKETPSK
jgi:hypothetical protein